MSQRRKILFTVAGIALALLAQLSLLDKAGLRHTEEGLNRALVTYGLSRGLNGVISVVQGTEIAIEPVGIGMTFTPGQILDPVNDLIERFSTVVLVSGTAFGVQRVFLDIMATPTFSIIVNLALLAALTLLWLDKKAGGEKGFANSAAGTLKSPVYKAALILLIIRFSVPLMAIVSENFYQVFLAPQFEASSQQLLDTTEQLQDIQAESEAGFSGAKADNTEDKSLFESARELYRSATQSLDFEQHLQDFKAAAENISEHAIKLMVVFVFQTIILPLGSLWLIVKSIQWVAMHKPPGSLL